MPSRSARRRFSSRVSTVELRKRISSASRSFSRARWKRRVALRAAIASWSGIQGLVRNWWMPASLIAATIAEASV